MENSLGVDRAIKNIERVFNSIPLPYNHARMRDLRTIVNHLKRQKQALKRLTSLYVEDEGRPSERVCCPGVLQYPDIEKGSCIYDAWDEAKVLTKVKI